MSKAFLPLGILAAAGVMGSLAGGQGSPARRRYIRPEVEEHYIQGVRDPAFVLGLTRPQQLALWWYANTLSGPQAVRIQEIVELHQAGELPTVDRDWVNPSHPGRSARGRRARKSAFERNVEGVWESDADQRARIRAGLNWISMRNYPSPGETQHSADIPGGHISYGKFGKTISVWMHRNKKDYALVKSRGGYEFSRVTSTSKSRSSMIWSYPAYGPYDGSATFRTGSDARKAIVAALAANPRVGEAARGRRAAPTTAERRQMGQKLQALPWSQASALYRRNHPEYKGIGGYPMNTKLRASGARSYGVAAYNAGKLTKKDVEIIFRRTSRRYPSMPKFDAMVCKTRKNGKHRNCKSVTSR